MLSDGTRNMNIYYVHPLQHVDGMLMAYLPDERILIEADLFDTHEPASAATGANDTLRNQVERLDLDVATIAPIHGEAVPWADFLEVVNSQ